MSEEKKKKHKPQSREPVHKQSERRPTRKIETDTNKSKKKSPQTDNAFLMTKAIIDASGE